MLWSITSIIRGCIDFVLEFYFHVKHSVHSLRLNSGLYCSVTPDRGVSNKRSRYWWPCFLNLFSLIAQEQFYKRDFIRNGAIK